MRSHHNVLVAATWILFGSVGCGEDKASNEAPASAGKSSASSATGSPTTSTTTSAPGNGSGGATGKTLNNSNSTGGKRADGTGGATSKSIGGESATSDGGTTNTLGENAQRGGSQSSSAGPASGGNATASGGNATASGGNATASGGNAATTGPCTTYGEPGQIGSMGITTSDKTQISGIVASRDNPGVLYAQADSGQSVIHALDMTGKLLGSISLNVTPKDWEDLSIGVNPSGADYLYVGDIGDNAARTGSGSPRTSILIYRFQEPAKAALTTTAPLSIAAIEKAELTYPNGAHDAETLIVGPTTLDLLILTKDENGKSIVYRAPDTVFKSGAPTQLEEVVTISTGPAGQLSSQVSAGDASPAGDALILRTYGSILLYPRLPTWAETFAATPATLPSPTEQQGEGLTFTSDGRAWICAGETSTALYSAQATCK